MNALCAACQILTRFRLRTESAASVSPREYELVLFFLPVVGLALGLLAWLVGAGIMRLSDHRLVGAGLAGLLIPVLYWWVTGARTIRGMLWMLENWPRDEAQPGQLYLRVSFFQAVVFAKVIFVGLIFHCGGGLWLVAVPVLSAAAFAELCAPTTPRSGGWYSSRAHWIVAVVTVLAVAAVLRCFIPALFAFVLAWLIGPACRNGCLKTVGSFGDPGKSATMELVELAALGLGAVYFLSAPIV